MMTGCAVSVSSRLILNPNSSSSNGCRLSLPSAGSRLL